MSVEVISEMLHLVFVRASQVEVGYLVETYEVYSAKQPSEQPYYAFGVSDRVVDAFEDNVLERQPDCRSASIPRWSGPRGWTWR